MSNIIKVDTNGKLVVFSAFDGISCGKVALDRLGMVTTVVIHILGSLLNK